MNQWLTMSQAARACGRVPGGNIHRLMVKWGVRFNVNQKGDRNYLKDDISRVPHLHRTATEQARNELIDRETKGQAELPLTTPAPVKPEKSIAEKLDGVKFQSWDVRYNASSGYAYLYMCNNQQVGIAPINLVGLAREIVRRIDGEPVPITATGHASNEIVIRPEATLCEIARQIVSNNDGCDYQAKYQELVKRLNELKEG